ncbi:MAG: YfiR family protein [Myxococcota bacterium]
MSRRARTDARAIGLALCVWLAGLLLASPPAGSTPDEYQVKAAFLLNFARLVEWPQKAMAADRPIVVSVLGSQEVRDSIAAGIGDAVIGEHPVEVQRIDSASEIGGSHILFVTRERAQEPAEIFRTARRHAALVVGESEGFAESGGTINFFTEDRKLRFEINPDAAKASGLKISSRLLRLAVLVGEER